MPNAHKKEPFSAAHDVHDIIRNIAAVLLKQSKAQEMRLDCISSMSPASSVLLALVCFMLWDAAPRMLFMCNASVASMDTAVMCA